MADLFVGQTLTPWNTATFVKPDVTVAGSSGAWTTGNSPITLGTVTGIVMMRVFGAVTTSFTSTATTGTMSIGTPQSVVLFMASLTANGTLLQNGYLAGAGSAGIGTQLQNTGQFVPMNAGSVVLTIGTTSMTAGGMTIYFQWIPLTAGATFVTATP